MTSTTLELIALALSIIPVALCAVLGYRAGLGRIIARGAPFLASYCAFVLAMAAAFRARWFEPLGLATPVLLGIGAAVLVRLLWSGRRRPGDASETRRSPLAARKLAGALAGAVGGGTVAVVLWLLLLAALPFVAPRGGPARDTASPKRNLFRAIVETANQGFIRHVPVVGPFEEELEALVAILETDPAVRAELVRRKDWRAVKDLESFQAVLEDDGIFEDIDGVRRGDLTALYRLQKNPRILAFVSEEEVIRLVRSMRPSEIVEELEAIERERGSRSRRR